MDEEAVISKAIDYMRGFLQDDHSGHDPYHTLRVLAAAERIAKDEGADLFTVRLAAILHDVDDVKLSPETAGSLARASAFMDEQGVSQEVKQAVLTAIREVSFKGSDSAVPSTIEGKCVQDADRLDAIGAIGIARVFAYGGAHSRPIYDETPPQGLLSEAEYRRSRSSSVNHFYEKLFYLKDMMNTASAKKLAEARDRFMRDYLTEFMSEWAGES